MHANSRIEFNFMTSWAPNSNIDATPMTIDFLSTDIEQVIEMVGPNKVIDET